MIKQSIILGLIAKILLDLTYVLKELVQLTLVTFYKSCSLSKPPKSQEYNIDYEDLKLRVLYAGVWYKTSFSNLPELMKSEEILVKDGLR